VMTEGKGTRRVESTYSRGNNPFSLPIIIYQSLIRTEPIQPPCDSMRETKTLFNHSSLLPLKSA
jgi:hypothetical protein